MSAYQSGFDAFENGRNRSDYPHHLTKQQRLDWYEGTTCVRNITVHLFTLRNNIENWRPNENLL